MFITAEDRHGNELRDVGYQRANFYGSIAGELKKDSIYAKSDLGNKIAAYERKYGKGTEIVVEFSDNNNIPEDVFDYIRRKQDDGYNIKLG